jgi:DNA polymerase-3 subunit alpha
MFTLHAHSNYSLLEGTIPIEELVTFAKKSGSQFVSLTDTNAMYGLIQFYKIAKENNIKPLLGAWIDDPKNKNLNAVFIAKNNDGYSQLCKFITTRKLKENFAITDLFIQPIHNLFVLTSSIDLLKQINIDLALRQNLFLELTITEKSKKRTRELYEFSKTNNLKIAAVHPAYFIKPNDLLLHKVVTSIKLNSTLENLTNEQIVDEEYHLKTHDELVKDGVRFPRLYGTLNGLLKPVM